MYIIDMSTNEPTTCIHHHGGKNHEYFIIQAGQSLSQIRTACHSCRTLADARFVSLSIRQFGRLAERRIRNREVRHGSLSSESVRRTEVGASRTLRPQRRTLQRQLATHNNSTTPRHYGGRNHGHLRICDLHRRRLPLHEEGLQGSESPRVPPSLGAPSQSELEAVETSSSRAPSGAPLAMEFRTTTSRRTAR